MAIDLLKGNLGTIRTLFRSDMRSLYRVQLSVRRFDSRAWPTFFHRNWPSSHFYGHSLPTAVLSGAVDRVLVNRFKEKSD